MNLIMVTQLIVETIHTGQRGRPSLQIDREFLQWAYSLRSISSIAHFLGVSRGLVRQQLVEHGIAEPQSQPFMLSAEYTDDDGSGGNDDVLDPSGDVSSPFHLPITHILQHHTLHHSQP
jgi:hypothetical protein